VYPVVDAVCSRASHWQPLVSDIVIVHVGLPPNQLDLKAKCELEHSPQSIDGEGTGVQRSILVNSFPGPIGSTNSKELSFMGLSCCNSSDAISFIAGLL